MQIGQLVDFCIECANRDSRAMKKADNNENGEPVSDGGKRRATQAEIDAYFG